MDNSIQTFAFEGSAITFNQGDTLRVNATEMARPFGNSKRPQFWLALASTKEFLAALAEARNLASVDLVAVSKGGNNIGGTQGTWFHSDVALEFARWLSPKFAIWCNDRIHELLSSGITMTQEKIEDIIANPDIIIGLATALKDERAAKAQAQRRLRQAETLVAERDVAIAEMKPKAEYYDAILSSGDALTATQIAKDYGYSTARFNALLHQLRVQFKSNGQWVLYTQHDGKGYVKSQTREIARKDGTVAYTVSTLWTQKGRLFLYSLLKANGILPRIDAESREANLFSL